MQVTAPTPSSAKSAAKGGKLTSRWVIPAQTDTPHGFSSPKIAT